MDVKSHWETIYRTKSAAEVSWYQREATLSLQLIRELAPDRSASIIDVGGGASTLVDSLLEAGYDNLAVIDIATAALATAQKRLGSSAERVRWIASDVLALNLPDHSVDVWHDRAVFHFLIAAEDRKRYVEQVKRILRPEGHVIIATFAEDGPEKCSGLPVARYDAEHLHGEFGAEFRLLRTLREDHTTPGGMVQRFRYCICSYQPSVSVAA
jgi:ubiquinone/menaquinone biosynthesis C-methylase UbiE